MRTIVWKADDTIHVLDDETGVSLRLSAKNLRAALAAAQQLGSDYIFVHFPEFITPKTNFVGIGVEAVPVEAVPPQAPSVYRSATIKSVFLKDISSLYEYLLSWMVSEDFWISPLFYTYRLTESFLSKATCAEKLPGLVGAIREYFRSWDQKAAIVYVPETRKFYYGKEAQVYLEKGTHFLAYDFIYDGRTSSTRRKLVSGNAVFVWRHGDLDHPAWSMTAGGGEIIETKVAVEVARLCHAAKTTMRKRR